MSLLKNILKSIKELNSKIDNLQTQLNNKVDKTISVTTANTDLNNYVETGFYYFASSYTPKNIPTGVNEWLQVFSSNNNQNTIKQLWFRYGTNNSNDFNTFVRTKNGVGDWSDWKQFTME